MPALKHTWQDVAELADDLRAAYPDTDPLRVSSGEIRRLITALPTFGDDPRAATTGRLEEIQAAWYDRRENT